MTKPLYTLEILNPHSRNGKPQWCKLHFAMLENLMRIGTHNGIAASLLMSSAFLDKIKSDGVLTYDPGRNTEYVMDMLRDSYSPFCCWLGAEKVQEILAASSNASLEETGILRQFEKEVAIRNKKVQRQLRRLK